MPQSDVDNGVDELYGKFQEVADSAELLAQICRQVTRKTIVDSTIAANQILPKEMLAAVVQSTDRLLDETGLLNLLTALAATNFLHEDASATEDKLTPVQRAKLEKLGQPTSKYHL